MSRVETSPAAARDEAEFFYRFLETPKRPIGVFDERDYYLGELALISGGACRLLFRREDAHRWFERSEASFSLASNGVAHVARLAYQRLALATEERRFDEVLEVAPLWSDSLARQGLAEEALKCRFLEALALRELGQVGRSVQVFHEICTDAEKQRNVRLIAQAANNLAQLERLLGNLDHALHYARKALPLLTQLNNSVGLVKLRWCVGDILRDQTKSGEAIEAYREALESAREVGVRGDQAALHLVLADLLLDVGQEAQAEWEVRAALPIIDEEKMVPEGFAALDLLRQALRRRQVDRGALRALHGYFRDA
jgi:tetratricopeptide (TPR) repeat protein